MALKAASENLRGFRVNTARLLNELMGSFDLDSKTGICVLPFQMAFGKCRSQVGYVKKAAYSHHAAKSSLENIT